MSTTIDENKKLWDEIHAIRRDMNEDLKMMSKCSDVAFNADKRLFAHIENLSLVVGGTLGVSLAALAFSIYAVFGS